MSQELQKAVESFCRLIPESKVGKYSPNTLDDKRLKKIYDTAIAHNENITPKHIIDCLKEYHPQLSETDIQECGDTAFNHMLSL